MNGIQQSLEQWDNFDKLTLLWTSIQVCLFIYCLVAWLGVAGGMVNPSCGGGKDLEAADAYLVDHHEAFAVVWHSLVAIAVSVGGTFVMKKHRTPIGLGLFVGAIFVMINWTLTILVLLGGQKHKKSLMAEHCKKDIGGAADVLAILLGVILLVLYSGFEYLLVKCKDQLLGEGGDSMGGDYPSGAFSSIDQQEESLTAV